MPAIGDILLPVCVEGFPASYPIGEVDVRRRPGMSDAAALFYAAQWQPQRLLFFTSAPTVQQADALIDRIKGLRRTVVKIDDGSITLKDCLVMQVVGTRRDAAVVVSSAGIGRYEISLAITVLPGAVNA